MTSRDLGTDRTLLDVRHASSSPPPSLAELPPGARVGRYVILKKLGSGGMGVVYMAYHEELDRRVALKLLVSEAPASSASGDAGHRLLREAQAMAKLSHPNVVAVYDVGTFGDQVFLAMEYVDGQTLRAWCHVEGRTTREIVEAFIQAGRGLEAAHAAGILHRDFKPENVLVDLRGRVRVVDFGLARFDPTIASRDDAELAATISSEAVADSVLTQVGTLVGTPAYMAPEQLRGERAEPRSDQFAFAVAFYEALYGTRPHEGRSIRELLDSISGDRPRLGPRNANVPRAVRVAIGRALRSKPAERFPTMTALVSELERGIGARRRVGVLAVVTALAAVAAAVLLQRSARPPVCAGADREIGQAWGPPQLAAVAHAFTASGNANAQGALERVQRLLDAYAGGWAKMSTESCEATRVRGVQSDEALDLRTACLDQRRRELAATTDLLAAANAKLVDEAVGMVHALPDLGQCADVASLRTPYAEPHDPAQKRAVDAVRKELAKATALINARRIDDAFAAFSTAAADARGARSEPLEAAATFGIGRAEVARGNAKEASASLLTAALQANGVRDDTTEASAWNLLVRTVGYDLGRVEDAALYARFAEAAIKRAGGADALRADLARNRAHVLYGRSEYDASLPFYREALALRQRAFGKDSVEAAVVEVDLADIEYNKGRPAAARPLYESVLATYVVGYGPGSPQVGLALYNLADAEEQMGDAREAITTAQRALAVIRPEDVFHASARLVLARALISENDVAKGMTEARAAYAEDQKSHGSDSWYVGGDYAEIAGALLARHQDQAAESEAEQAIEALHGTDAAPGSLREAQHVQIIALTRIGRASEALPKARAALAAEEKELGVSSPRLLFPLLAVGEAELALDQPAAAVPVLSRALGIVEEGESYESLRGDVRLALSRALVASHGDAGRARSLAERAARDFDDLRLPDLAREARTAATRTAR